ncbi:MAG: hypothetical protein QM811_19995 [Pirellulales bacterium]
MRRLVEQLGAPEFSDREAASQELLDCDLAALDLLREAARHGEAEIRSRARRLLVILEQRDFDLRLSKFARDYDDALAIELPAWKEYRKVAGDDRQARDFFVAMQRAEQRLLAQYAADPEKAADLLAARIYDQLMNQNVQLRVANGSSSIARSQLSLESVAVFWLIAGDERVELNAQAGSMVCNMVYQTGSIAKLREPGPGASWPRHGSTPINRPKRYRRSSTSPCKWKCPRFPSCAEDTGEHATARELADRRSDGGHSEPEERGVTDLGKAARRHGDDLPVFSQWSRDRQQQQACASRTKCRCATWWSCR